MNHWIEIDEPALAANFRALEVAAGPATSILAVIKSNAYGHGAELCARVLARAGAPWLGVTSAGEGARVRQALAAAGDPQPEILVMCGFLPADVSTLREHRLTPVVWTPEQLLCLPPGCPVHLEIDTGMARQGVPPGAALDALLAQLRLARLDLDGIFTHFASAEEACSPLTRQQQKRFERAVAQLRAAGLEPRWLHAGNTSTLDNPPQAQSQIQSQPQSQPQSWLAQLAASIGARAMVRSGLGLYGYCLPIEAPPGCAAPPQLAPSLRPVLRWLAPVLALRELEAGDSVGYNATFTAAGPMQVALLPVGYADGLRRELSSTNLKPGGWVMLHGQRAPILGRVSMNLTVVDIGHIPGVAANDVATILGPGITAEDHARLAGTIAYEILCGLHPCG